MNELKQQKATLVTELEALENRLPHLEAAWRNAPSNYSAVGNMIGSPEKSEAMDKYSCAQARLRSIPGEINRIEQKLAYLERITQADQIKKESIHAMSKAAA